MGNKLGYHTGFLHPEFNQVRCFLDYDNNFINAHLDEFELPEHKVFWLKWLKAQIENEPYNSVDYNTFSRNSFEFSKKYTLRMIDKDIALWESAIKENRSIKSHNKPNKTYRTKLSMEQIEELFNQLKHKLLISPKTRLDDFQKIFANDLIENISSKVEWIGKKNLLAYFLDNLFSNQIIDNNTDLWAIAKLCFQEATNLKQLKNNYLWNKSINGKPRDFDKIDFIINHLK